ncbi:tetratricopeptide repeat protein [Riemerella anatipestifer]|uniref:tetratricopeptide repeat protein n=1 Tax=Riemerella anatipestifer TaxID=34085 RepID=UPI00208E75FF|nr:tetratricopeptide repeat protein [Riemerella anatipestifer]MCO4304411.1 tetratricopeptide repeat protein [Riemerella anatipestifer]MCO7351989.1 tetratricopeptide repeat protein [Riemerella anatipestifer]MCQ4038965.1 tetratricopeptide repeat protein [Riemerella anatipestifer]MCT6761383.1 tetratricopeptide repeat protein [Riemerella anatipestifer]MCT6764690.1 tetratricopeptide repeat protein [Riemerella anatipestifer]
MKKVILSIAVFSTTLAFSQKKEIQNAFKAIESGDIATTNAELSKADVLIGNKLYLVEPSLLEQYYYSKGVSLIKSGKTTEGAAWLGKIGDLGKSKIYTGKDAEKNKVYFVGKEAADASGIAGLKEDSYASKLSDKLPQLINPMLKTAGDEAYRAYQAKDHTKAATKYLEVYNLLKAAGTDDKLYQYYAGLNYALANDKSQAIEVYSDLIKSGYTGVTTVYKAKNKKSGQDETLDKNSFEMMKRLGSASDYTDFRTEQTPSIEQELYETNAALLIDSEKYTDALNLLEKGIKKFPKSSKLSELQGTAYYKSGKTNEFINNLKSVVASNPNDKVSWYNLGVLLSKDEAKLNEAEGAFKRALEIDPDYVPAIQGIFYNIYMLGDDGKVIERAEAARKAKKMDEFNKILQDRRDRFAKGLPYLEKWYSLEPKNPEIVSLLRGVYQTLRKEDKVKEMKAVEDNLNK